MLPEKDPATQIRTQDSLPIKRIGIFQQPWWLTAAAGQKLETAEVVWSGQQVARIAFVRERRLGITRLEMPPYTRTLGPDLQLPPSGPAKHERNHHRAIGELLRALPLHDRYQTTLAPDDPSAFPLLLSGCSLGQNFTFRSPSLWNLERHWTALDQKTRNLIRSASKELAVMQNGSIEDLINLSLSERGPQSRVDRDSLRRLAVAAETRGQMITITAQESACIPAAVATLVWDDEVLYFWQSARDRASTRSGAVALLIWEAMGMAHRKGLIFDMTDITRPHPRASSAASRCDHCRDLPCFT